MTSSPRADAAGLLFLALFLFLGIPMVAVFLDYMDRQKAPIIQVGNIRTLPEQISRH